MASFSERISVIIDVTTQKATSGLKNFRQSVGEAEGFTGKLKAGVGSLTGMLGPAGMAGAATAAAGAAFKMASDFSDLGVEVGKFATATGTSNEQASRWVEVANDLGIGSDALQGILGRLNKNIDPKLFASYGIEIARAADGTVDANQTFLNTIDVLSRMKDPAEQSKAAAKLLGRGWQGAAELIGMSAKDIQKRLDGVDAGKVFGDDKVKKAREFRDSMDELNDKFQSIALELGEAVVPAISDVAHELAGVVEVAGDAGKALSGLKNSTVGGWLDKASGLWGDAFGVIKGGIDILRDGQGEFEVFGHKFSATVRDSGHAANDAANYIDFLADRHNAAAAAAREDAHATDRAKDATKKLAKAAADLNDIQLDGIASQMDAFRANLELTQAAKDLDATLKDNKRSTEEQALAVLDYAEQAADAASAQAEMNGHTETAQERNNGMIMTLSAIANTLDPKSPLRQYLNGYIMSLSAIPRNVSTTLSLTDPSGRPASAVTSGSGSLTKTPDGERSLSSDRDIHVHLKLNDRTLQTISIRQDELKRGMR